MEPKINERYRLLFTNFPEYYSSNCDDREKFDIKSAVYIGEHMGKYLFRKDENGEIVRLRPQSFNKMVLDENNETCEIKSNKSSRSTQDKIKYNNEKQNYLRFVVFEKPYFYKGDYDKPRSYITYIALQVKNKLYYVKDNVVQTFSANAKCVLIDPCDDEIPVDAPQKLVDLYEKLKVAP